MQKTLSYYTTALHKNFLAFCNHKLQKIGLTQGLMYFLLYIDRHPGCSPGNLAASLHFDIGHTARSLDKLEQDAFLLRTKNPSDKRAYCLNLCPRGERAILDIRELLVDWDNIVLRDVTDAEQKELLRILEKLKLGDESELCTKP